MKKRDKFGRFKISRKNFLRQNYEKILLVLFLMVLGSIYVATQPKDEYLDLSCSKFIAPVPCDNLHGIENVDFSPKKFTTPAPEIEKNTLIYCDAEDYKNNTVSKWINDQEYDCLYDDDVEQQISNILTEGGSSWYSWDGCLGCNENRIMANGVQLDDSKPTLAVTPQLMSEHKLLNDWVTVTNLDNGESVVAQITDTGGFAKYNRVADLSVATSQEIDCYNCNVRIERID